MVGLSALRDILSKRPKSSPKASEADALAQRLARRKRLTAKGLKAVPFLRLALLVGGYTALLLLPSDLLSRGTYVSENAIQPGQVNTYWSWGDVGVADEYAKRVESWAGLSSEDRASSISGTFGALGLPSATQNYSFRARSDHDRSTGFRNGTNAYGILPATRADGSEALVLMASWLSRAPSVDRGLGPRVNVRGVASILALAQYLRRFNLWSKDIIFLVSDGYSEGAHAWLQAYHGVSQSNAELQHLSLTTGGIWAALALDYPYHSFDHLELYYEGPNGQLPNLDLINTIVHIARWAGGVPTRLHSHDPDHPSLPRFFTFLPSWITSHPQARSYLHASHNVLSQLFRGALNTPSGPEGLFLPYRISAVCLYGPPAEGPHGFHALGKTVESSLRSMNNILERLHQSFWLYLMHGTERFVSVGNYLFGPILVSVAVTVTGLERWAQVIMPGGADESKAAKGEAIVLALAVIGGSHAIGLLLFFLVDLAGFSVIAWAAASAVAATTTPLVAFALRQLDRRRLPKQDIVPLGPVLHPFILLSAGAVLAVVSVLSFSVGATLGVIYGVPLCYIRAGLAGPQRWAQFGALTALSPPILLAISGHLLHLHVDALVGDWEVLGTWCLPFAFGWTAPLVMQLGILALLD